MSDPRQWAWKTEHCEHWNGPHTYAEALADAKGSGETEAFRLAPVVERRAADFPPDADALLEIVLERVRDDVYGDAEPLDVSPAQAEDLDLRIAATWAAWCEAHGVPLSCFSADTDCAETWKLVNCEACDGDGWAGELECAPCDGLGSVWARAAGET